MKYDYNATTLQKNPLVRIGKRSAYHQAGHAAAIYLGNKQKNLPALHFQIAIKPFEQEAGSPGRFMRIPGKYGAKLEGGRLISDLPHSYQAATRQLSSADRQKCQYAFESDVINLLAGSLAEAKYVALRDDEVFNANLVYLGALKFYGGGQDLKTIYEYIACLLPNSETERNQKLAELFLAAYSFITDRSNWKAITALAETIYSHPKDVFSCEEVMALLDSVALETKNSPLGSILSNPFGLVAH
ncbi:hypothetical protein [Methyloglobulus sp.]|uniref:hypothetical protein n=1 Tax=Methyloglobulus sp. TaxID=2518622 RepID=UPI0039893ADB